MVVTLRNPTDRVPQSRGQTRRAQGDRAFMSSRQEELSIQVHPATIFLSTTNKTDWRRVATAVDDSVATAVLDSCSLKRKEGQSIRQEREEGAQNNSNERTNVCEYSSLL